MDDPFYCYKQTFNPNLNRPGLRQMRDELINSINSISNQTDREILIITNYRKGTRLFEYIFGALETGSSISRAIPSVISIERVKIDGGTVGFIMRPTKVGTNPFDGYSGMLIFLGDNVEQSSNNFLKEVSTGKYALLLFLDSVKSGDELRDILKLLRMLNPSLVNNILYIFVYSSIQSTISKLATELGLDVNTFKIFRTIDHVDCDHVKDLQSITGASYEPWEEVFLPISNIASDTIKEVVLDILEKLYPNGNISEFESRELFRTVKSGKPFVNWNVIVDISDDPESLDSFVLRFRFFKKNNTLEKVDMMIESIDAHLDYEPDPLSKKCPLLDSKTGSKLRDISVSPYCNNYLFLTQNSQFLQDAMCIPCLYYNFARILRYNIENELKKRMTNKED